MVEVNDAAAFGPDKVGNINAEGDCDDWVGAVEVGDGMGGEGGDRAAAAAAIAAAVSNGGDLPGEGCLSETGTEVILSVVVAGVEVVEIGRGIAPRPTKSTAIPLLPIPSRDCCCCCCCCEVISFSRFA